MSTRRIVAAAVAATLAVPLFGLAVVQAVDVFDGDDGEAARERTEAAIGLREVTSRVRLERAWAAIEMLGATEMAPPRTDVDENAVPRTDDAVAAFRADLDRWSEDTAAPYRTAVDGLDELALVRADVDAVPAGTFAGVDASDEVIARYDTLIHALDDAAEQAAASIEDRDEARGAALLITVAKQVSLGAELTRTLALAGIETGTADTAEGVTTIAEQLAAWETGLEAIGRAEEPFASVVAEHHAADETANLSAVAREVLGGEPVDMRRLLAIDTGMVDLEAAVAARQAEVVARAAAQDDDDERLATLIGSVALTGALGLLVFTVVVVVTGRTPPPPGPWGPDGPGGPDGASWAPPPPGVPADR